MKLKWKSTLGARNSSRTRQPPVAVSKVEQSGRERVLVVAGLGRGSDSRGRAEGGEGGRLFDGTVGSRSSGGTRSRGSHSSSCPFWARGRKEGGGGGSSGQEQAEETRPVSRPLLSWPSGLDYYSKAGGCWWWWQRRQQPGEQGPTTAKVVAAGASGKAVRYRAAAARGSMHVVATRKDVSRAWRTREGDWKGWQGRGGEGREGEGEGEGEGVRKSWFERGRTRRRRIGRRKATMGRDSVAWLAGRSHRMRTERE
ncbi:hypothetical protein BDY21DRAFT_97391 [Lineolata rhizophorae]|uniref:Uncharacterized protein n=1 Tax=Lineolata rhizophorae TaxID=578093 RepID=A0A6A6NTQ9_9PEZI|nr:hypothetical protein BDY21DRAFT_97391 [Lineolata rhizophorae]